MRAKAESIAEYISWFPKDVRTRLKQIHDTIQKAAPKAEATISYGIPAFKLNGALVYFAAFPSHISLYPVTSALKAKLGKELAPHTSPARKGTMRFPLDKPLPLALMRKIVKVRVQENLDRPSLRAKKK